MEAKNKLNELKALFAKFKTLVGNINDVSERNNHHNGNNGPQRVDLYDASGKASVGDSLHVPHYSNVDPNGGNGPQRTNLYDTSVGGSFNVPYYSSFDPNGGNGPQRAHLYDASGNASVDSSFNVPHYSNVDPNGGNGPQRTNLYDTSVGGSFNMPYYSSFDPNGGNGPQRAHLYDASGNASVDSSFNVPHYSNVDPNGGNGPQRTNLYDTSVGGSFNVPYYSSFDPNGGNGPQRAHLYDASGNASVDSSFNVPHYSNVDPNGGNGPQRTNLYDTSVGGSFNMPYYSNFDPNGGNGPQRAHLYDASGNASVDSSFNVPHNFNTVPNGGNRPQNINLYDSSDSSSVGVPYNSNVVPYQNGSNGPQRANLYDVSVGGCFNVPCNSNSDLNGGNGPQQVNLYDSPANDSVGGCLHVIESILTNEVFGVDVHMETTVNSHLEAILNKEESNTTLRNYFFYLYDNTDVLHNLNTVPNGDNRPQNINLYDSSDGSSVGINNEGNAEVLHEPILQQDVNDLDHFLGVENIAEKAKPVSSIYLPKQIAEMQSPFQLSVTSKQVRGCDNTDMYVEASNAGVKKQCCPFCGKLNSKLPRHMEDIHGSEPDVQEFLKHPKNSAERKAILEDLRITGNFDHNRIAELNKKLYIPIRRPNVNHKREAFQHTPCPYCRGAYTSTGLRLHIKYHCKKKPKINDEKSKGVRVERVTRKLATAVDGRIHESASIKLEQLLQTKRGEDNVLRLIRFDWLIVLYGNKLCKKYTRLKNKAMIRSRLRLGGRILIAVKNVQPEITDLASLYHPKFYDFVVKAIEIVARHNAEQEEFDFPGTASKCITGIREIAAILISEYIKRDNVEKHRTAEKFMTVFNTEISTDIGKAVAETQVRRKTEKQVIVPSLGDVTLLARHIDVKRNEFFEKLSISFSYENWVRLAEATVGSIIVFNRKRIGDVEDILVGNFKRRESIEESSTDPLYQNLSEEEKKVARQYSRMKVRGKKGNPVFVMLKPEFEKSIELLLSHRQDACIPEKNGFLFALPSSVDEVVVMNAYKILRKFALSCEATNPSKLNGTLLRQHLATHCASLELCDSRVADVASFMGHSETVHRKFYRQNTVERQFVHLPQVLEASQGNATVLTFPNQMNTKQMTRDTDLERKRSSTSQPKYQLMQKENARPQNQRNDNFKKGKNNNTKKTVNKQTNKRQLRGSHNSATRSNKNVDLKKCNLPLF